METLAIYGAIVSTIALGWNIYKYIQENPRIKVNVEFGFVNIGGENSDNLLIVSIINKGEKSIYLSSTGLRSRSEDLLNLHTIGLPCELKGRSSHNEWFEVNKLKRDREYDFGWYKDATGRIYKSESIRKKIEDYFKNEKEKKLKWQQ